MIVDCQADVAFPALSDASSDWRCTSCNRLLGIFRSGQLHIRFARGHQYLAALPTSCICRSCGTLNRSCGSDR